MVCEAGAVHLLVGEAGGDGGLGGDGGGGQGALQAGGAGGVAGGLLDLTVGGGHASGGDDQQQDQHHGRGGDRQLERRRPALPRFVRRRACWSWGGEAFDGAGGVRGHRQRDAGQQGQGVAGDADVGLGGAALDVDVRAGEQVAGGAVQQASRCGWPALVVPPWMRVARRASWAAAWARWRAWNSRPAWTAATISSSTAGKDDGQFEADRPVGITPA